MNIGTEPSGYRVVVNAAPPPTDTVTITSGPSGTPNPVASSGTVNLSVGVTDSQSHQLSYSWSALCSGLPSNGSFSNASIQNPTWTAPTNTTGSAKTCTFTVTASDGGFGHSDTKSFMETVNSTTQQTGTIQVRATLNGAPWFGIANYTLSGPTSTAGNQFVSVDFLEKPAATWTLTCNSGGPTGASLTNITPSPVQTLSGGSSITFTLNFSTAPVTTGNLTVTVRRSDTNALLSGATVTLSGGPSSPAAQTTVADGTTTFSNLAVGNYTVTASLVEFKTNSASAMVVANTTTLVPVGLTPSQELTPPPPQSPPPVDPPVALTLGGKAVVITHGWNSDASSWVSEMAEAICRKHGWAGSPPWSVNENGAAIVCQVDGWDVWVYDWRLNAEAWLGWEFVGGGLRIPDYAKSNAGTLGARLAIALNKGNYQHIHFIAHSAGANLIEEASRWMKAYRPTRTIHETFLDAYDPAGESSSYGLKADWADNYVDTRNVSPLGILDGTKLFLRNAYSIDVTPPGIDVTLNLDCPQPPNNNEWFYLWTCRHSRPFRFYGYSIDPNFVIDFPDYQDSDPISSAAGRGYPLSVENGLTLGPPGTPGTLSHIFPPGGKCVVVQDGICYPDAPPPSMWSLQILLPSYVEVTQQVATFYVEAVKGATNSLYSSIKMGWSWVTGLAPQQTLAVRESATSGAATDYLVVNVTTTTPVNTLRFNWSFAAAGEGLLRVFVGGNLVREIDQRYVTPSSPETEEIYIGGEGVPLLAGTHRITFRLDGFGTSASGVELTDVDLGLLVVGPTLTVTRAGTGSGTVTSDPAGIDCGTDCSEIYASAPRSPSLPPRCPASCLAAGVATALALARSRWMRIRPARPPSIDRWPSRPPPCLQGSWEPLIGMRYRPKAGHPPTPGAWPAAGGTICLRASPWLQTAPLPEFRPEPESHPSSSRSRMPQGPQPQGIFLCRSSMSSSSVRVV